MGLTDLSSALWITLIAIILVFAGILVLWAVMELLVHLTTNRPKNSELVENTAPQDHHEMKQKVAAAAVVTALYVHNATMRIPSTTKQEMLTPWQSMHRNYGHQPQPRRKK